MQVAIGAVRVLLNDQDRRGVDGLNVSMTAFHHSHGRDLIKVDLESIGGGQYQCLAPIAIAGLWDFDFAFDVEGQAARVVRTTEVR